MMTEWQINRKQYLESLRDKGFTYDEIGKQCGISKQRVQQIIGKESKGTFRALTADRCIYDGLRKWMNENHITVTELTRRLYGNTSPNNYHSTYVRLNGLKKDISKSFIDKVLAITNLTYEEAFKQEVK